MNSPLIVLHYRGPTNRLFTVRQTSTVLFPSFLSKSYHSNQLNNFKLNSYKFPCILLSLYLLWEVAHCSSDIFLETVSSKCMSTLKDIFSRLRRVQTEVNENDLWLPVKTSTTLISSCHL